MIENYNELKSRLYAGWLARRGEIGESTMFTRRGIALLYSHETDAYTVVVDEEEIIASIALAQMDGAGNWKTTATILAGENSELEFTAPSRAAAQEHLFWDAQLIFDQGLAQHGYEAISYLYRVSSFTSDQEFAEYLTFCADDDELEMDSEDEEEEEMAWA